MLASPHSHDAAAQTDPTVREFRHIAIWPLQIVASDRTLAQRGYHTALDDAKGSAWSLLSDEFGCGEGAFQERHYREFVSFLPHVQRFLYGEGGGTGLNAGAGDPPPVRVYRRGDVRSVRIVLEPGGRPIVCDVPHVDLYFFHDVDAVILVCEIAVRDTPLSVASGVMQRFGRAYPAGWTDSGEPANCPWSVEWLDASGAVLAAANYADKRAFLNFVGEKRAARMSDHWSFLLAPLTNHATASGALGFREIEYSRMPAMSYVALDSLDDLTRHDYIRLTLGGAPRAAASAFSARFLKEFEARHVYDRFYADGMDGAGADIRFLTSGETFCIVSGGPPNAMNCNERGLLGQFRHQYFLLFLIAHFHKAALLMLSDRMVAALKNYNSTDRGSIDQFRDAIFSLQESFLRFSQRYLFAEISGQAHLRDMFRLIRSHLAVDKLHQEVRGEIIDMVQYLDSSALRRQSGAMHRLTVVTVVGLVGAIATGFLGMNILDETDNPLSVKAAYFAAAVGGVLVFLGVAIAYSRRLGKIMDKLSGDYRKT
ncbi:MAG: hypothetical protein NW215_05400 [Hyphomicrobiales bacterium]|nr:hypothetical protein [Hyphomicrobiales bacterium]